jgi:hypothetical protein
MKKWMMPIGLIVVICILAASVAMPICLADQNRIEIEGRLIEADGTYISTLYEIGELGKGDEIKVVITDIRGNGDLFVSLTKDPQLVRMTQILDSFTYHLKMLSEVPCCGTCCLCLSTIPNTLSLIPATAEIPFRVVGKTFRYSGEEQIFTIPKDGMWYLKITGRNGDIPHYKGYIEVIKVPAVMKK